ncbi:MAG: hypothetical protein WCR67_06550 [Bacilli bacterium]
MNKKIFYPVLFLIVFVSSLLIYLSGAVFISTLSGSFAHFFETYPIMLVAPLTITILYFLYQHFFSKPFTKKGLLIASIILSAFSYSGIETMLQFKSYYFQNSVTVLLTTVTMSFHALLILAAVALIILSLQGKINYTDIKPEFIGLGKTITHVYQKIGFIFFGVLALYFLGGSLVGLCDFNQYVITPGFPLLCLAFCLPIVSFFIILFHMKTGMTEIIVPLINIGVFIAVALTYGLAFEDFLNMTASLLLVEYATSFPIGVSLYVIMDLGSSVYYIVRTIKNKRKQSA